LTRIVALLSALFGSRQALPPHMTTTVTVTVASTASAASGVAAATSAVAREAAAFPPGSIGRRAEPHGSELRRRPFGHASLMATTSKGQAHRIR
jgi:hypothetical protein